MFKILSICLGLLLGGTLFAASGESERDVATPTPGQRVLSTKESILLKDFLCLSEGDEVPNALLNATLYFAQNVTEDAFCAAMARVDPLYVPEDQAGDILTTYLAWLQGPGKDVEVGSANDPLARIERTSEGWDDDDVTNQFRKLLSITEEDVLSYVTAATSLNETESGSGSESESDYEDIGALPERSIYVANDDADNTR